MTCTVQLAPEGIAKVKRWQDKFLVRHVPMKSINPTVSKSSVASSYLQRCSDVKK